METKENIERVEWSGRQFSMDEFNKTAEKHGWCEGRPDWYPKTYNALYEFIDRKISELSKRPGKKKIVISFSVDEE